MLASVYSCVVLINYKTYRLFLLYVYSLLLLLEQSYDKLNCHLCSCKFMLIKFKSKLCSMFHFHS